MSYHTDLGRFAERDPNPEGEYADGMNFYVLGHGNPVKYTDPLGLAAWDASADAKYDEATIAKLRAEFVNQANKMIEGGEVSDCADVAYASIIRAAAALKLPISFKYYSGGAKYYCSSDNKYQNIASFEKDVRNGLGAINLFDNTKQIDLAKVTPGDLIVYDLRFQKAQTYGGHTLPVLDVKRNDDGSISKIIVAEGHLGNTKVGKSEFTIDEINGKWKKPGLMEQDEGTREWKMKEEGARIWNWKILGRKQN